MSGHETRSYAGMQDTNLAIGLKYLTQTPFFPQNNR